MQRISFGIFIAIVTAVKYYRNEDITNVTMQDVWLVVFYGIMLILEDLEAIKKKILS